MSFKSIQKIDNSTNLEKFKNDLQTRGYLIHNHEFYFHIHTSRIGMKVGEFTHSCHVDTTDFYVILFLDSQFNIKLEEVCDLELNKL